jgi:hypothetical protein
VSVTIITGPRDAVAPPKERAVATAMAEPLPMYTTSRPGRASTAWLNIREQATTEEGQLVRVVGGLKDDAAR